MTIYIVRHGQTDWNLEGRYAGRTDIPINETGIKQANIIKEELKEITFDKVYASPLKRAYETAKIIYDGDIITDERIIERSNGDLDGKLKSEIKDKIDFNDPNETKYNIESINNFRSRIYSFFDDLLKNDKDLENILVVTHSGVGIYARCYFEGEPENNDYTKYKIANCQIIKFDVE